MILVTMETLVLVKAIGSLTETHVFEVITLYM